MIGDRNQIVQDVRAGFERQYGFCQKAVKSTSLSPVRCLKDGKSFTTR
jgi:hypothetical protein